MTWTAILVLAAGAYLAKAAGLLLGPRLAIGRIERSLVLLPAALLAALVIVQTFDGGRALVIDARVAGVAVGALAAWRRVPFAGVVIVAAFTTALIRAL